jgi:alcohol dehydrogenase class IV
MQFEFTTPGQIIFGEGTSAQAAAIASGFGSHALVVTGSDPGRAHWLLDNLERQDIATTTYAVVGEPHVEAICRGTALGRRRGCDHVIGIGGGSAIDTGKAIAAMLTNAGELFDYLEIVGSGRQVGTRPAPLLAIPTTAGTGAEATCNAVIAVPEHQIKVSLRSPLMMARAVIVDPVLTYDLPPNVTATTGMDALTQLIEPFVCTRANPLTDAICREGLMRAARSLHTVFQDGSDVCARADMSVAGLLSGMALANAGLGAVHGIAGPLGGMVTAPHGALCAALLPHVVRANIAALRERDPYGTALDRYRKVAALLGRAGAGAGASATDLALDDLPGQLETLVADLAIPPLQTYGLLAEQLPELAERAMRASSMKGNPVVLDAHALMKIVRAAL